MCMIFGRTSSPIVVNLKEPSQKLLIYHPFQQFTMPFLQKMNWCAWRELNFSMQQILVLHVKRFSMVTSLSAFHNLMHNRHSPCRCLCDTICYNGIFLARHTWCYCFMVAWACRCRQLDLSGFYAEMVKCKGPYVSSTSLRSYTSSCSIVQQREYAHAFSLLCAFLYIYICRFVLSLHFCIGYSIFVSGKITTAKITIYPSRVSVTYLVVCIKTLEFNIFSSLVFHFNGNLCNQIYLAVVPDLPEEPVSASFKPHHILALMV